MTYYGSIYEKRDRESHAERVADLERSRDAWQGIANSYFRYITALETALRRWTEADGGGGEHMHDCDSISGDPCSCGLEDARRLVRRGRE